MPRMFDSRFSSDIRRSTYGHFDPHSSHSMKQWIASSVP